MNPSEAVQVEVIIDDLTPEEERDRLILERQVERAFYQAGKALKELRDRLRKLHSENLEETPRSILQSLGQLKRPF